MADRLRQAGIDVGSHRIAGKTDGPSGGGGGQTIGPVICTPISTVITRCNTNSDNLYAECLLKRIGHAMTSEAGSWTNGRSIIRHILHQRLNDPAALQGVVIIDGSGLSNQNRVTARTMTAWLNSIGSDPAFGNMFINSLAVGGQSGTLRSRMPSSQLRGATVYAKTGYISQVSCLSGYVVTSDGRRRSFSILVNNLREGGTVAAAKKLQDQIVAAIAADMPAASVTMGSD
jgi:serine-type D-Ala-D-Ala carboxypeptidase/endopeptidase (penicillin-binding protein 4)